MAISILYNSLSSILKFIPNFVSRKKLVIPTTSSNSSSYLSLQGVNIFIKNSTSADLFIVDPDTSIARESSFVPHCVKGDILAYSNGLVFGKSKEAKDGSICVYNPTKKSLKIILPPVGGENLQELVSDFGLSTVYNGHMFPEYYRFVLVVLTKGWDTDPYYRVYESEKGAWTDKTNIDVGPRNIHWGSSVVLRESIYWVSDYGEYIQGSKPYILGLCLETGNAQIMHHPKEAMVTCTSHRYQIWITKYDEETLCMVQYDKSHDVMALWEIKLVPFPRWKLLQSISMVERQLEKHEIIYCFTLLSYKEYLAFDMRSRIYMYDLRRKVLKKMWYLQLVASHRLHFIMVHAPQK